MRRILAEPLGLKDRSSQLGNPCAEGSLGRLRVPPGADPADPLPPLDGGRPWRTDVALGASDSMRRGRSQPMRLEDDASQLRDPGPELRFADLWVPPGAGLADGCAASHQRGPGVAFMPVGAANPVRFVCAEVHRFQECRAHHRERVPEGAFCYLLVCFWRTWSRSLRPAVRGRSCGAHSCPLAQRAR